MILRDLFKKPVDRPIEGVIKADDEATLLQELEEYVLTKEIAKRMEQFLGAYNNYTNANGVWVSGFFGSGKSHLLKMLALVLENRSVNDHSALELLLPKCEDNEFLKGELKKAATIPAKSILFNIDQKANVVSKSQIDALLAVFVKVFDEMCGYYGKLSYIAQFERHLDERGKYEDFKAAYKEVSGKEWIKGREQALLEKKNITHAYAKMDGDTPENVGDILKPFRDHHAVSIEDFADMVKSYIDRQVPDFRLNFFVDEVGQYIAGNIKLMTNLQTIAESLATKCRGQAWVVVTAQEEMDSVIGEMDTRQANDFSKIQARFNNRMKLTSADVAEVIQGRLLAKTDEATGPVSDIYDREHNNFETLFRFMDGGKMYRNFRDRDHFVRAYPFIPYQFDLFQVAIQALSAHNAFEGRHSSVGERSMLGVFQQVAIQILEDNLGQLATFDCMFDGIRTALKAQVQQAVTLAERNLDNPFGVRILKALFLVKYVPDFKASATNLTILLTETFHQDVQTLRTEVEEALNLLEQQNYIQRSGNLFEYLSNEEKDVQQEIKNVIVESNETTALLTDLFFDSAVKGNKIRDMETSRDFPFTRKLDANIKGREHELTIHMVSPYHEQAENIEALKLDSMNRSELLVVLPADDLFLREVRMYKQTHKYVSQNTSHQQQESRRKILAEKQTQNAEREKRLKEEAARLVSQAKLVVSGNELDIDGENPQALIAEGFQTLVRTTYRNLSMLGGVPYKEEDIPTYLKLEDDGLFGNDVMAVSEPEQQILAKIQNQRVAGNRMPVKDLVADFEKKPYGWPLAAILCNVAKLYARGRIEIKENGVPLSASELEKALVNSSKRSHLLVEPLTEYTPSQIRRVKELYRELFDGPASASDARGISKEVTEAFEKLDHKLRDLISRKGSYPFLATLEPFQEKCREISMKQQAWIFENLPHEEEDLLDFKEEVLDPIDAFITGPQKEHYDGIKALLKEESDNLEYLREDDATLASNLKKVLGDAKCYEGRTMQAARQDLEALRQALLSAVQRERKEANKELTTLRAELLAMEEANNLSSEELKAFTETFDTVTEKINGETNIPKIWEAIRLFTNGPYKELKKRLTPILYDPPTPPTGGGVGEGPDRPPVPPVKSDSVSKDTLNVCFEKREITSKTDVDTYVEALRTALLEALDQGKTVVI
ncbi:hypothetical protein DSLASN_30540 [Desulfoluna limicola]|uniref:BREX system P-loop protein BrxC n=1 Tax=Desulfoluna limicola TaxID=2810562 RepID=A0ABM7PK17_9BACT|nr:BREX system P-loop protein BrxC [Desulfoluna limicola]BCS97422.1 hypothetical protein DSLASN_30540 [Desulfoluna limicola]